MSRTPLLNFLWRAGHFTGRDFSTSTGENVRVVSRGEPSETAGVWDAAQITADGERRRGMVAVGADTEVPQGAILRVVESASRSGDKISARPVLGSDDLLVPQIEYEIEPRIAEKYDELRSGAGSDECAARIAGMDDLHRTALYTALLVDRLERKTRRVMEIFEKCEKDWHQTFHTLLLQAMGGDKNKETFTELAGRATSMMLSREKSSLQKVEALLLGTAGFLLSSENKNPHLDDEFRHLAAKYQIVPLKPAEWNLAKLYPANHPAVRLKEIAALVCKREFMLDAALDCLNSDDVERLFTTAEGPSIGKAKARLVGINLVAPLMFAYGKETASEPLCERALDLLATIPAEKNSRLDGWYSRGVVAENGFDSQALLELATELCAKFSCADCRIGRAEIKKMCTFTR